MKLHEQIQAYYPKEYSEIMHYPAEMCVCIRSSKDE